ncbi:MAG: hypothetical protein JWQ35_633, partial [Bacteriovoracaceae bacterium]|nr:hypothetical protein [Bacteriovoracaceae bacterium]
MKLVSKVLLGLNMALIMAACADSSRVSLPPDSVIIEKQEKASVHPTDRYYLGQVQLEVGNENQLSNVMADMKVKKGIDLSLINQIPGQPIYLMEINSLEPVDSVVKALKSDRRVVAAARNHMVSVDSMAINDPLAPTQWGLQNIAQEAPHGLAGKSGADIGMDGVTAQGSYEVVVGVIDTGVDYYHEDLAITETIDGKKVILPGSNIWTNPGLVPGSGVATNVISDAVNGQSYVGDLHGYNFVSRTPDPMDDMGHGTHVSGIIGALRNNYKGIAGINQKVSLMGLKFLGADGSGSDFNAQLAIYYTIGLKNKFPDKKFILTNSWGSASRSTKNGDEDDFLLRAFARASKADILSVAAAGNDGTSNRYAPHYPANFSSKIPNFITVGATDNMDQLASFSSYGFDQVNIAAPGVLIMSTVPEALFGVGYQAWSGTSMATPFVTGAAALVWSENLTMTASQVKERLLSTVDVLPQLHGAITTSGRLNV